MKLPNQETPSTKTKNQKPKNTAHPSLNDISSIPWAN
jgi:hypothetical protein